MGDSFANINAKIARKAWNRKVLLFSGLGMPACSSILIAQLSFICHWH